MQSGVMTPGNTRFFGLHFDLHPRGTDTELGKDLTSEMVARLIDEVKPDFVQYDCKGHPGYAGYSTAVGHPSPGIVGDALAIWREVTKKSGVDLYIHYSGVWDTKAIDEHPEWARIDEKGDADDNKTSSFSPYCEKLLIPQLKEAIDRYDLDGVWVDGDCWAAEPDFTWRARELFMRESSCEVVPLNPGDPRWGEYLEFNRERFRSYLRRYVKALHGHRAGFRIASNWMYSSLAPEPITVPVDYISGDFSPTDSVNTARVEARYMSQNGLPWDLMSWGFNRGRECGHSWKTANQLKQEAAIVLSQGGGFQVYYNPTRSGWIDDWMIRKMSDVSRFCHARREFCFGTETVPQIGLLLSRRGLYAEGNRLFGPWGELTEPLKGMLHALLELHYSVDVMAEHQLYRRLGDYPMIVVPERTPMDDRMKDSLTAYVREGGTLLLVGIDVSRSLEDELGVEIGDEDIERNLLIQGGDSLAWVDDRYTPVEPASSETVGVGYHSSDTRGEPLCAASMRSVGEGRIAGIYAPLGGTYSRSHNSVARRFLRDLMKKLFHRHVFGVEALPTLEVVIRRREGTLLVNLTNTAGMQTDPNRTVVQNLPLSGPVAFGMMSDTEPEGIALEPGHSPVVSDWTDGWLKIMVPNIEIHRVLSIEGGLAN
jgi:hypothetical protein